MTYCTPTDVRDITGISESYLGDSDITRLIEAAERRCEARIIEAGLEIPAGPTVDDTLRDAAAYYTAAALVNRRRIDLTRSAAFAADGLSYTTTPDTEIAYLERRAEEALKAYISENEAAAETFCARVEGV